MLKYNKDCYDLKKNNKSSEHYNYKYDKEESENKCYIEKKYLKCCCKLDIKKILEILGQDRIRNYLNFNAAAFVSNFFLVGSNLSTLGTNDNLGPLDGSLNKLNSCNSDLLEISGSLSYPSVLDEDSIQELTEILGLTDPILGLLNSAFASILDVTNGLPDLILALNTLLPGLGDTLSSTLIGITSSINNTIEATTDIVNNLIIALINTLISSFNNETSVNANADLASVCSIKAIVFEVLGTTSDLQILNYNLIKESIKCLDSNKKCSLIEDNECCCNNGIKYEVIDVNLSGKTSLTAGPLILQNVEILGYLDNLLILGSPYIPETQTNAKIYLVCTESVQFIL